MSSLGKKGQRSRRCISKLWVGRSCDAQNLHAGTEETFAITSADKRLRMLLRVIGVLTLLALFAVFTPKSWMASTHEWLGLGELSDAPIVQNLSRSVSAFYALFGAVCLVLAADPERYRLLVRYLGVVVTLCGVALIGIELMAKMPRWWTASKGLSAMPTMRRALHRDKAFRLQFP